MIPFIVCAQFDLHRKLPELVNPLTASFFLNCELQSSGDQDNAQWSRPSFSNNGYPPFEGNTQNPGSRKHLLQLGIHGDLAKCDLRKIMGKIRYYYIQN